MKNSAILFLFLLCFSIIQVSAQATVERVDYLKTKAVVVRNVEPTNEDYTDLAPLKQTLQQATVVGLGEPIHFDGSAFKAKTRLIKFLHQEMGFSVIAFESGFYDCYKAWQEIQQGKPTLDAARKSLYSFWISTETEELFAYIDKQKNTDRPLILAGIDCKISGIYARETLLSDLRFYLETIHSSVVRDTVEWQAFSVALERAIATSDSFSKPTAADTLVLNKALRGILAEIKTLTTGPATSAPEQVFWQQFCRSLIAETTKKLTKEQVRDRQMGENLTFLQRQLYPNRKVIVWAASSHLTYNGKNIDYAFYQQNRRLGDYLKQDYGEQYYNIGFTGYQGKFGKLWFFHVLKVKNHRSSSIEYALGQTKQPFLFIDFRKAPLPQWLQNPIIARPFGYKQMSMKLPLVMDGLFYSEQVFQSHWIPPVVPAGQKR